MRDKNRLLMTSVALAALVASAPAYAKATDGAGTSESAVAGNEIVVTAQRRDETIQDVSIALSVVSAADLASRGITNVNQLENATPSLQIEPAFGGGQPQFRLRGVGFNDYASNNAPTVGIYVNEVAYPIGAMTQGLIFDVSRVEVLRGPQGTLYGRNTTGGAINFVVNKPTDVFEAGVDAEYERFNSLKATGFVSGPLGEGMSARVSVSTEQGGAFRFSRDTGESLGDADKLGGRFLLAFNSGAFKALVDVHASRDRSEAQGLYLINDVRVPRIPGVVVPADRDRRATGWDIPPTLVTDAGLDPNGKPGRDNDSFGTSLNTSYDFGGVVATSITSFEKLDRREYSDWDGTKYNLSDVFFGTDAKVFSQELKLTSDTNGPLTWTAGIYYASQIMKEKFFTDFDSSLGLSVRVNYDQDVKSISGYGQAEYKLTPALKLTAGFRYENEVRKLLNFTTRVPGFGLTVPLPGQRQEMSPFTGKLALNYDVSGNTMVYVSASKGVKSGGFTAYNTTNSAAIAPFKEETLYAYEVGLKSIVSRAIQVNLSAFYYDYRNQQVLGIVCGANGPIGRFENARKSRIYGVEGDVNLRPARGLTITAYASYKNGKFLNYQTPDLNACIGSQATRFVDKSGTQIPFAKVDAGATVAYEIDAGDFVVRPSANMSFRSRSFSFLGAPYDLAPFALVNAEISLSPQSSKWTVAAFGRNVFNKQYDLVRNFFLPGQNVGQTNRPATYGIRASYKFN